MTPEPASAGGTAKRGRHHERSTTIPLIELQPRLGRLLPRAFIGAQRPDDVLHLGLELLRVLPPSGEVGCQARADGLRLRAFPLEQVAVKIQRNQGQHLLLALFHQQAFFFEGGINFVVHPPARQRVLGAAEQDLVPHPDAAVHLLVDVVAGQHLLFVQPAANAAALQRIVQAAGKQLVLVAVADEAGVELDGADHQRPHVFDEGLGHAAAAQEDLGNFRKFEQRSTRVYITRHMRLPQDIANLLAVAIRDVIWYKNSVVSFLKDCGVPPILLKKVEREFQEKTATVKVIHKLLDDLDTFGESGWVPAKTMLTKMNYWKGLETIEADRRPKAEKSLAALRLGMKDYLAQQEFESRKERETREKAMQADREARETISTLDHKKLQSFRDEFDSIYKLKDERERGNKFEPLMNRIFAHYNERSEGSFRRTGEQVDGLFYFDKHWYFVEIRWKGYKTK